jgi:DNA-binding NarL/FixJ family response regulator
MSHALPTPVFVVHADPIVAAGIRALLMDDVRFRVCVAEAGAEDFQDPACVVIADRDCARDLLAVRGDPGRRGTVGPRMLIVSQLDGELEIRAAVAAGVEGYVLQGCSAEELRDAVGRVANGVRYIAPPIVERLANSLTHSSLTAREGRVLHLVAAGMCNKLIARELAISVGTVKSHVRAILGKLSATSRVQAVCHAQTRGLLPSAARPPYATGAVASAPPRASEARFALS